MIRKADVKALLDSVPADSFLKTYVCWALTQTDAPAAYQVLGALSCLAVSAPDDFGMYFAGGMLRTNVYGLAIGRSGEERKSTAVKLARNLLKDTYLDWSAPEPGSVAALREILAATPKTLVTYEEFGKFLAQAHGIGGVHDTLKTAYTDAYDCSDLSHHLKGKRTRIEHPRLSLIGGCSTAFLEMYTTVTDWTGGFLRRFMTFYAEREDNKPKGGFVHVDADLAVRAWLLNRFTPKVPLKPCSGFDDAASVRWDAWHNDVTNRALPSKIVGARASVPPMALKVAMLLAWDYDPNVVAGNDWQITRAVLDPAILIVEMHLKSVVALSAVLTENQYGMDSRKITQACLAEADEGRTLVSLGTIINKARMKKRLALEMIESMVEEGVLFATSDAGGRLFYSLMHPSGVSVPLQPARASTAIPLGSPSLAALVAEAAPVLTDPAAPILGGS